ncbi:MAG: PfkB family carbohydrate kinase [Anaerolineae bacterium]|nr:PfkB family carbohydrate kinase [Anaerolineae bacterium]
MYTPHGVEPVDYLVIGHLSQDLTPNGPQLGGSAAYAAVTAEALGLRVGVLTSWDENIPLELPTSIQVRNIPSAYPTTFENIETPQGRQQVIHRIAETLEAHFIPETWRQTPLVHLAPIAHEVPPAIVQLFPQALLCLTPQGWLREWDRNGQVTVCEWPEADYILRQASAAVISIEDVEEDQQRVAEMAAAVPILVVTAGAAGASLYQNGEQVHFAAPQVSEIDSTGAGDIFAAAFFIHLHRTNDPNGAVQFANHVAARSVTRRGLESAPSRDEIYDVMTEVN